MQRVVTSITPTSSPLYQCWAPPPPHALLCRCRRCTPPPSSNPSCCPPSCRHQRCRDSLTPRPVSRVARITPTRRCTTPCGPTPTPTWPAPARTSLATPPSQPNLATSRPHQATCPSLWADRGGAAGRYCCTTGQVERIALDVSSTARWERAWGRGRRRGTERSSGSFGLTHRARSSLAVMQPAGS